MKTRIKDISYNPSSVLITAEDCFRLAEGCATCGEFWRRHRDAYLFAQHENIFRQICKRMGWKRVVRWTNEALAHEARNYNSRTAFSTGSPSAYVIARNRGILDDICAHMTDGNVKWTDESIREEARKYSLKTDFRRKSASAYRTACIQGKDYVLDICRHMKTQTETSDLRSLRESVIRNAGSRSEQSMTAYVARLDAAILAWQGKVTFTEPQLRAIASCRTISKSGSTYAVVRMTSGFKAVSGTAFASKP